MEAHEWIRDGVLRSCNDNKIVIGTDIAVIIAEYAMGYLLNCCVWDCGDAISIHNRWDLWQNMQGNTRFFKQLHETPNPSNLYGSSSWYRISKTHYL